MDELAMNEAPSEPVEAPEAVAAATPPVAPAPPAKVPGFHLEAEPEADLSWSFQPFADASGELPVFTFKASIAFAGKVARVFGVNDPTELADGVTVDFSKINDESIDQLFAAISEVCGGNPSVDVLSALPAKHVEAFLGWLMGHLGPLATSV